MIGTGKVNSNNFQRLWDKAFFYIVVFLIVFYSVSIYRNYKNVQKVNERIASEEKEVQDAEKKEAELQKKLEYTKSQEYIEKQLRDKLGLAKEGEIVVILPPAEELRKFAPKREEEIETLPDPNWKKWFKVFGLI